MENFAERLRRLRKSKKLSQVQLAIKSGVSQQGISNIESGRHEPTSMTVKLLADALGVKPSVLLDGQEEQKEPAPDRSRQEVTDSVIGLFASLPPELQAQALGYLRGLAAAARKK